LWRIVRLINRLPPATQELRERFTRQLCERWREHLAGGWREPSSRKSGAAAIDLYGGNLRVKHERWECPNHTAA